MNTITKADSYSRNRVGFVRSGVVGVLAMTLYAFGSVASASDLEIYQVPATGKKTLVMMLDTSGSMGSSSYKEDYSLGGVPGDSNTSCTGSSSGATLGSITSTTSPTYPKNFCQVPYSTTGSSNYQRLKTTCEVIPSNGGLRCFDRLTRLKDAMFNTLEDATLTDLPTVRMGMGNFSADAENTAGQILVPAKALGSVGSAQRVAIKNALAILETGASTPSAHAFAEAAAYLMGTTTYSETATYPTLQKQLYQRRGSSTYTWYECTAWAAPDFPNNSWPCSIWTQRTSWTGTGSFPLTTNGSNGTNPRTYYRNDKTNLLMVANEDSGTPKSKAKDISGTQTAGIVVNRAATDLATLYQSPLPTSAERVSCDGQGIYFLSDGEPNGSSDARAAIVMKKALGPTLGASFTCPASAPWLPDSGAYSGQGAWECMGEFAKKLYGTPDANGLVTTNPAGVPIQTAFVGFGSVFAGITTTTKVDAKNACQLGSSQNGDDCYVTNPNSPKQSYGRGGFFAASSTQSVSDSLVTFIRGLAQAPLKPLVTGAPTIPIDGLNPSGFQPYGYFRMLQPNPADKGTLLWNGNIKKFKVAGGALKDSSNVNVLTTTGEFATGTTELWNKTLFTGPVVADGGFIDKAGTFDKIVAPLSSDSLTKSGVTKIRPLFTDLSGAGTALTSGTLLPIPLALSNAALTDASILSRFLTAAPYNGLGTGNLINLQIQLLLLNYLGYNVPLTAATLPTTLVGATTLTPYKVLGGTIHSQPIQLSYEGTLDSKGKLTSNRVESVLYGSMEGALHLVKADNTVNGGKEQMVFVPFEILSQTAGAAKALKPLEQASVGSIVPTHGVDGAWVSDTAYKTDRSGLKIRATRMNVYGGLRMGGNSYYGLDLCNAPSAGAICDSPAASTDGIITPKLLFRIGSDVAAYSRMGQSWSKPLLANVRYNGVIKRVMFVGGGYDKCYESGTFKLGASGQPDSTCNGKSIAQGNAVYMVDALTGARLWWASNTGANTTNASMTHSIVSRVSTLDRNADGLVDHIYFGDLGGNVFRADFDNANQRTAGNTTNFGVRVVRLANLANSDQSKSPRFYEPPTLTIHDYGVDTFILVGIASGNRSSPLDILPLLSGGQNLTAMPVNNVYGIMDRDFVKKNLLPPAAPATLPAKIADSALESKELVFANLQPKPQLLNTVIPNTFFGAAGARKEGWYRSLSDKSDGTKVTGLKSFGTSTRTQTAKIDGGMKAFEEPIAIAGTLLVPVYDPEGEELTDQSSCAPRVVGETVLQRYCLPYGVCLQTSGVDIGKRDNSRESDTGANQIDERTSCVGSSCNACVGENCDKLRGAGITGIGLGGASPAGTCGAFTLIGNVSGNGEWTCNRSLIPVRWYEKQPNPAKVK